MATLQDAFNQAVALYQKGDLANAGKLFAKFQPGHGELFGRAQLYLGRILAKSDPAAAERHFVSAQLRLSEADGLFEIGEFYFQAGRFPEAERAYRRAAEFDPKFTDVYIRLGMIERRAGKLAEALRSFEIAILNDQRAVVARYMLAQVCIETQDMRRALSQLHFVVKIQPDFVQGRLLMAEIYQRLGDHRQALVEYCQIVNQGGADAGTHFKLARSFHATGDQVQAARAYERAFSLDPSLFTAGFYAAQARESQGHPRRALALFRALLNSPDHQPIAQEAIARLEFQLAQFDLSSQGQIGMGPEEEDIHLPFEPPAVQATEGTAPLPPPVSGTGPLQSRGTAPLGARTGGFSANEFDKRPKTRPLPEVPQTVETDSTALQGFLKGMMDTVKKYLPNETKDTMRQRLDPSAPRRPRDP